MEDLPTLRNSYDSQVSVASRFAERLAEQIYEVISSNDITLAVPIEKRVKSWQSVSAKIERNKLELSDVGQVGDFVGVRVILLFRRDLERVIKLLSMSLKVTSSEDALERLGVEMFGYQSVHLQAEMPESWGQVPTLKAFAGLKAEIQVRTAAQQI
jgi:putative GTP pyrophosphokinase